MRTKLSFIWLWIWWVESTSGDCHQRLKWTKMEIIIASRQNQIKHKDVAMQGEINMNNARKIVLQLFLDLMNCLLTWRLPSETYVNQDGNHHRQHTKPNKVQRCLPCKGRINQNNARKIVLQLNLDLMSCILKWRLPSETYVNRDGNHHRQQTKQNKAQRCCHARGG